MKRNKHLLFIFGEISQKWLFVTSFPREVDREHYMFQRMFHPANRNARYQYRTIR